jgi:hypothetical protein
LDRAKLKAVVRDGNVLHHDRLIFRITWTKDTVQIPSVGYPVLLKRPLQYPVAYPLKRVYLYAYPQGTEMIGYADADSREVRAE